MKEVVDKMVAEASRVVRRFAFQFVLNIAIMPDDGEAEEVLFPETFDDDRPN